MCTRSITNETKETLQLLLSLLHKNQENRNKRHVFQILIKLLKLICLLHGSRWSSSKHLSFAPTATPCLDFPGSPSTSLHLSSCLSTLVLPQSLLSLLVEQGMGGGREIFQTKWRKLCKLCFSVNVWRSHEEG